MINPIRDVFLIEALKENHRGISDGCEHIYGRESTERIDRLQRPTKGFMENIANPGATTPETEVTD